MDLSTLGTTNGALSRLPGSDVLSADALLSMLAGGVATPEQAPGMEQLTKLLEGLQPRELSPFEKGLQNFGTGVGIAGDLAGIYAVLQGTKLAKKNFGMQRDAFNANLQNTTQTYNTRLADRARSRFFTEGRSDAERDQYVSANSLKFKRI